MKRNQSKDGSITGGNESPVLDNRYRTGVKFNVRTWHTEYLIDVFLILAPDHVQSRPG